MDTKFNKPKTFGEILDHTFILSKNRFKDFFLILLILMGPIYLLQAIIQLLSGVSFFRELGSGELWFEQILSSFDETAIPLDSSIGANISLILTGLFGIILFPVAEAAVLFAINHIRKNEEYSVGSVIKEAFSRFWPILGSTILFGLITFGLIIVPILMISFTGVFGAIIHPAIGIIFAVLLFLGFAVGIGYLLTRWSFYFGSVVLDRESPGFTRSWRLTKKRTWLLMGLYIIFYIIITTISSAIEITFGIFLGKSVLLSIIVNLATILTTMLLTVGYAVMYLDLKTRHDADDIKDMIEDYKSY
ncbi:hypothetical protein ACFFHH_23055 [Cytobacillus solani]|uniref:Glycerophosphoryl diester phosphodiesterase membrane domain-containing protein n=1 Tax=Cytobacillus solani TaxID=1637975 RepID=A0A0Q3QP95_9BACI|nr:hypothetical protein [Cytobacillus solani]KOP82515.1 hypothetical protein AMS60_08515 [Bacillus sp. FJAT-21945]KQL19526.1 hypothetical protein AN957_13785 [Cytobacillus solani]USK52750.1 hypothetical protein LIS82_13985 [Cytobacillus solani]